MAALFLSACGIQCEDNSSKPSAPPPKDSVEVVFYLTKPDQTVLFTNQVDAVANGIIEGNATIEVLGTTSYQSMEGFGFTLTGGSALALSKMDVDSRSALLTELFAFDGNNIGISYLRLSIGASDLDEFVFSYNDIEAGTTDFELEKFSMDQDRKYLLPVLKEILAINPEISIISAPWSPPTWMKSNGASKGGELKKDCYAVYAQYFIKYIQEMEQEGITVNAITVQNEPLHPGNNPSMYMSWQEQAEFIKNNLGPAFEEANITTKIILYDHNADRTDYPISIMDDPDAKKFVAGSAFHLYGGSINDLSKVHTAHPDKDLYFTEQWTGSEGSFEEDLNWHTANIVIGGAKNWCRAIFEWNLAADPDLNPHTPGGCTQCLGALTIDGNTVTRNVGYYIIAHASKFVRPGDIRVASNEPQGLKNVAFKSPNGATILIIQNQNEQSKAFNIKVDDKEINTELPANGVGTFVL